MGPICQECNEEQLHVIALENTGGMVTYACEQCGAKNTLVELTGVKPLPEPASGPAAEADEPGAAGRAGIWTMQEADSG